MYNKNGAYKMGVAYEAIFDTQLVLLWTVSLLIVDHASKPCVSNLSVMVAYSMTPTWKWLMKPFLRRIVWHLIFRYAQVLWSATSLLI